MVLITGAKGFLGQAVMSAALQLFPHQRVVGVTRKKESLPYESASCDLTQPLQVRHLLRRFKPTVIIHAAGCPATEPWERLVESCLLTTSVLIQEARRFSHVRFVLPSSSIVYGRPLAGRALQENQPALPLSAYGHLKLAQENIALSANSARFQVMVGRLFNLLGDQCPTHLVGGAWAQQLAAIKNRRAKDLLHVGNIDNERDFLDIADAGRAYCALAQRGRAGEIYNVCSGRRTPLSRILSTLQRAAGIRARIIKDPGLIRSRDIDPKVIVGSNLKICSVTGWKPQISFSDSVLTTWETYA